MKRLLIIAAAILFLYITLVFAAEKAPVPAPLPSRVPEMSTAGKVLEISDTLLKIERTLKGNAETMEFALEKPFPGINIGDQIKVNYREKGGRNILIRVTPAKMTAVQKGKPEPPKSTKNTALPAEKAVK
jgi:hypothetical protein